MSSVESQAPDWESMQTEVTCPLCDYNLRGLIQPRCPECGYTFAWDDLLDEARRHHRYIFEHHAKRTLWSFARTLLGGLRPKRFWSELHPWQKSHPMRLVLYLNIIVLIAMLPMLIEGLWHPVSAFLPSFTPSYRRSMAWSASMDFPWNILEAPLQADARELLRGLFVVSLALPVVTYLLLMIFQQTMRKAKLRFAHVLRCITYSADVALWPVLPLCLLTVMNGSPHTAYQWEEEIAWMVFFSLGLIWLTFIWRMICAYRYYLRFDHPAATIISVQIIILLGVGLILYNLQ
jgi:hypothetical protein